LEVKKKNSNKFIRNFINKKNVNKLFGTFLFTLFIEL